MTAAVASPGPQVALMDRVAIALRRARVDGVVTSCRAVGGGRAGSSVRADIVEMTNARREVVVRFGGGGGPHYGIERVEHQAALMLALGQTDVPVPRVLGHDASEPPPVLVTAFVAGEVPDPWTRAGRALLALERAGGSLREDFADVLARIHRVPVETLPAAVQLAPGTTPASAELRRWTPCIKRSQRFADDPVFTYAAEWLSAHEPPGGDRALVHGDYRVGNLVLDGPRIAAVLDWELARVSDPLLDVATVFAAPLRIDGHATGLWEPAQFIRRYEERSGRTVDRDRLAYWTVMATYKIAAAWVNASAAFASGRLDLPSLRAGFSVLEVRRMLAQALGLVTPAEFALQQAERQRRVWRALHRALRSDVLPSLEREPAAGTAAAAAGVLRALSSAENGDELRQLAREARHLLGDCGSADPKARISASIRAAYAERGCLASTDADLAPLRALVGRAANLSLGMWP